MPDLRRMSETPVRHVLVCSRIPKLMPALRTVLPEVEFLEVTPEDMEKDEVCEYY